MADKLPPEDAKVSKPSSSRISSTIEKKLLATACGDVPGKGPESLVIFGAKKNSAGDYLKIGELAYKHWQIVSRIGCFGDAQVYQAINDDLKISAIVRACKQNVVRNSVYYEGYAMRKFSKTPHCPMYYGSAIFHDCYITIVEPLGPDLHRLRCEMQSRSFTDHTAVNLAVQCIRALQDLHNVGLTHRRISGKCFALSMSPKQKGTLFLTDLGFVRPYRHPNGGHRSCRGTIRFYGHIRYASIYAHSRQDLSRRDDLWSLFYLIYEIMNGFLPWEMFIDEPTVHAMKNRLLLKGLCVNMPSGLDSYAKCVEAMDFTADPNYSLLIECIEQIAAPCKEAHDFCGFDWEKYDTTITQKHYYC
ncbi:hypothetical protein M514_02912 [Trichuris suis]|uniref:Protein kinase domain-containing protein n=1 Tax=Trichuris suis TaxID=68888 RepID=A0A085MFY8_9BILA|nr:hypothetical protein M513_02912 [Trichuris suis]KFD66658.1 hypothetical protein M514_02912 [Trichuris suis]